MYEKDEAWFYKPYDSEPSPSVSPDNIVLKIPILNQCVSAGGGSPVDEYAYISTKEFAGKNIHSLRVVGDCLSPVIEPGDVIFYDTDASPHDKDLVVVSIEGNLHVKRFRQRGKERWLEYNTGTIEINGAQIVGVVEKYNRSVRLVKC